MGNGIEFQFQVKLLIACNVCVSNNRNEYIAFPVGMFLGNFISNFSKLLTARPTIFLFDIRIH